MIIQISGKIGSGKDTVGKIIQYLYYLKSDIHIDNKLSYEAFDKTDRINNILIESAVPKIVKYADALKDIICILTGCTREQLEDSDFKNSKLPDEWNHHTDDYVITPNGFIIRSYRDLLQYLGTELFRDKLHPDCWVNALYSKYKPIEYQEGIDNTNPQFNIIHGNKPILTKYPNWIVTDCRFKNEADAGKAKGGLNIRVRMPKYELWKHEGYGVVESPYRPVECIGKFYTYDDLLKEADKLNNEVIKHSSDKSWVSPTYGYKYHAIPNIIEHESETALDDYQFDEYIDNNGTIDELIEKVKEMLIRRKLI